MTYALRPEGIEWPMREDGKPSFKLEHLAKANGLLHEAAHDALSDVRATIALARLIKQQAAEAVRLLPRPAQEGQVADEIGMHLAPAPAPPFLHVSGMFPAERGCIGWCGRWPRTRPTRMK
jgi:exodeoxyribonuclease-1